MLSAFSIPLYRSQCSFQLFEGLNAGILVCGNNEWCFSRKSGCAELKKVGAVLTIRDEGAIFAGPD